MFATASSASSSAAAQAAAANAAAARAAAAAAAAAAAHVGRATTATSTTGKDDSMGATTTPTPTSTPAPPASSAEELLAHQLEMHRRIQQQMQLQMEMSLQIGNQQRQSLTASIAKVDPDLGDNVFDMLDDLIMVAPERASLSKAPTTIEIDSDPTAGRDSLADIMESLDMDLDDFELETIGDLGSLRDSLSAGPFVDASALDEERDSFDDVDFDFDDDLEDDGVDVVDHGVDDDDDDDDGDGGLEMTNNPFVVSRDPNEHAVSDIMGGGRQRLSSSDMLASVSSMSSLTHSTTGNLCTLVWEGGMLGIRLRMSQSKMLPAVSKLTGRSSIYGIHLLDIGDLLVEIGGRLTRDMELIEAINYLKEAPKPCKLVFRRIASDPMVVKPVQPPVKSALALKLAQKFEELTAVEEEKTPAAPHVKLEEKYEIKWDDGPLGISLIASKDAPYPLVTRITGKNRSPQVQDVQPGHFLVQIGSYDTSDGNFNTAIKYLQKVSKPVSLYFCPGSKKTSTRPDPSDDEYEQVWEKKQALCFTVRPDELGRMVVADLGSAKSVKAKPKAAGGLNPTINSGDQIIWINEDIVKEMSFHEALLKLRTAKRPLVIRFKKAPPEPPIDLRPPPPPPVVIQESPPTSASVPKSTSRSFNPLKKIAALGSYAKENSMNALNQRNEAKKPVHTQPDEPPRKKSTHSQDSHDRVSAGKISLLPSSSPKGKPHARDADSNGHTDPSHSERERAGSKLINLEALNALRKPVVTKSSSDSNISGGKEPQTTSPPTSLPSRSTRNSAGRHSEERQRRSSSNSTDRPDEYEVIWPEGTALGLTLRVHPTTRFPVVARVTGVSNLKNIEHVTPGDILYAANGVGIVPQAKFKQTLENLSKLPKPAVLRFRRASTEPTMLTPPPTRVHESDNTLPRGPSLKDHEYELIWRENSNLGLVFSTDGDVPRVSKVDVESGGPSVSIVAVGDTLTFIGPMDIAGSSFHSSMATLRAVKRPVVLRFHRRFS